MPEQGGPMSCTMMFWALTAQEKEVLCVSITGGKARIVSTTGDTIIGGELRAISLSGIHFGDTAESAKPVAGLFLDEAAAKLAAGLPRKVEPWDDWFYDQTRQVLRLIGWDNSVIKLAWLSFGGGPFPPETRRFRDRLPDFPLAR